MKKLMYIIFISSSFLIACNKNSAPAPAVTPKPFQVVVSNITSTLTIYNISVINQNSEKLVNIYAQTDNNTYTVNVNSGDVLQVNYFLELEGVSPETDSVISFKYNGFTMASVTNHSGTIAGAKYINIP